MAIFGSSVAFYLFGFEDIHNYIIIRFCHTTDPIGTPLTDAEAGV